jgi:hypothetical protein
MPDTKKNSKLRYTSSGAFAGAEELQYSVGVGLALWGNHPALHVRSIYWTREYDGRLKQSVR